MSVIQQNVPAQSVPIQGVSPTRANDVSQSIPSTGSHQHPVTVETQSPSIAPLTGSSLDVGGGSGRVVYRTVNGHVGQPSGDTVVVDRDALQKLIELEAEKLNAERSSGTEKTTEKSAPKPPEKTAYDRQLDREISHLENTLEDWEEKKSGFFKGVVQKLQNKLQHKLDELLREQDLRDRVSDLEAAADSSD